MINWVIQTDVFGTSETLDMIVAVEKGGISPLLLDRTFDDIKDYHLMRKISDLGTFAFRGSLQLHRSISRRDTSLINEDMDGYTWTLYHSHIPNLLNNDFLVLPASAVKEQKRLIIRALGNESGRLFIRPDEGQKLFTGTTLTEKWFDKEIDVIFGDLSRRTVHNDDLIVFSSYKEVKNECRVVMGPNGPITWAVYEGEGDITPYLDSLNYPSFLLHNKFYTVDVCLDTGKVIEINSFACAGLYGCDYNKIVEAVNKEYSR